MSPPSLASAALAPTTLSADVFQRLREDILSGRFAPDDKLRLHDLRERYDVGFSPLREALMYLASDGLVVVEHQKGFRVAPISLDDLWDVTRTRQMIEEQLLTEAIEFGDDGWEADIVAAFHRLEKLPSTDPATGFVTPEWAQRHYAFHRSLIAGAHSRLLKRFWQMAYDQSDRYRRISASIAGSREDEHKKLMKAAIARDTAALIKLNRKHIETTAKVVAEQFANVGRTATPSPGGKRKSRATARA
jgi:GntR family transcriptional regulator, carbon starvation induced regulator